jgi:hypothetical protein
MKRILWIAACLVACAAPPSSSGAQAFLVNVKVPSQGTFASFTGGRFQETVTCREACRVSTRVLIRASAAKRFGFKNVTGKLVLVATNSARLKARTPTKLSLTPTREAKTRLGQGAGLLELFGSVQGVPNSRPTVNVSVGWASRLVT